MQATLNSPQWRRRVTIGVVGLGLFLAALWLVAHIPRTLTVFVIGTLMAFVIVCAGVWVMRVKRPEVKRPFKTPWVPFVPIMGIIISLAMMLGLNGVTWIRLVVWLAIGLTIYFTYGVKNSHLRKAPLDKR